MIDLGDLPIMPEVAEHESVEFVLAAPPDGLFELQIDNRPLEAFLLPGDGRWHWRWNAGMAVGLRQAMLHSWHAGQEGERHAFEVRVLPRKIDQECYEYLLDDLERILPGLARALGGTALEGATMQRMDGTQPQQLDALVGLIGMATERLERAAGQIARRPHQVSRPVQRRTTIGEARRPGTARGVQGSAYTTLPQRRTAGDESLVLPHDVIEEGSNSSFDTYEHRLLKRLLDVLVQRAQLAARMASRRAPGLLGECEALLRRLRVVRGMPLFEQVGPLSAFRGP
ncbi:MAG TPA: DUF2357 domain-containing protein, partial [Roseiflexaceae bacterium]|nr:DUF2357 domain-containing protein [Roseiflexaceae bacterium]